MTRWQLVQATIIMALFGLLLVLILQQLDFPNIIFFPMCAIIGMGMGRIFRLMEADLIDRKDDE